MVQPVRQIKTDADLQLFLKSRQFAQLWTFITHLNSAVLNQSVSFVLESSASNAVKALLDVLDELYDWTEDIEPVKTPTRFGNPAFRTWHEKLTREARSMIKRVIRASERGRGTEEETIEEWASEVAEYLTRSFGDATRIDYGSGHEAMFLVLLYCLCAIQVFKEEDDAGLVLLVFVRYLRVTRQVQTRYMLEPAGSHGVWGLDDYSFLPFVWGSAQLIASTRIPPSVISDDKALAEHRSEYLYLDAIATIKEMKTGAFFEHSPMLHDISQVRGGWAKINQGMLKMYRGEVWEKRVVIQHFVFGSIFKYEDK